MKKKLLWWSFVAVWCFIIFYQSNKPASASGMESTSITNAINSMINSLAGLKLMLFSDYFIRKAGHFIEYFILGFLVFKAFETGLSAKKAFLYACAFSILYSISDELHQHFVPGRAPMVRDVMLDSAGIITGAVSAYFMKSKK